MIVINAIPSADLNRCSAVPPRRPKSTEPAAPPSESSHMQLQSKPHQLAEFLKQAIRDNTLTLPLPGVRLWSQQLGVSRRTLHTTLHALQKEGWVTLHPRGTRLNSPPIKIKSKRQTAAKQVRWLTDAAHPKNQPNLHHTFDLLYQRLKVRGITLKAESCTPTRLREIARQPDTSGELFLLGSLSPTYQRLLAATTKPALVLGEVASGIELPSVNVDQSSAVRHATFRALRRDCSQVILVHMNTTAPGMRSTRSAFSIACKEWTRSKVTAQFITTHLDRTSLHQTMRRIATRIKARTGILVLSPVPISMVVTALLQHGIAVPKQAEVIALLHPENAVQLYPTPPAYLWPMKPVVRQITAACEQFFNSGTLPADGEAISAELVKT